MLINITNTALGLPTKSTFYTRNCVHALKEVVEHLYLLKLNTFMWAV